MIKSFKIFEKYEDNLTDEFFTELSKLVNYFFVELRSKNVFEDIKSNFKTSTGNYTVTKLEFRYYPQELFFISSIVYDSGKYQGKYQVSFKIDNFDDSEWEFLNYLKNLIWSLTLDVKYGNTSTNHLQITLNSENMKYLLSKISVEEYKMRNNVNKFNL